MIRTHTFEEIEKLRKKEHLPKEVLECINKHFQSPNGMRLWSSGMKNGITLIFENIEWNFEEKIVTIQTQET